MKKIILSTLLLASVASAEAQKKEGITALSTPTRALLSQEMRHIEKGMHQIFSFMIRGNYEAIVPVASDIRDSFIFKKKLTKEQILELQKHLPKEFVDLDRSFHELSAELSNAAEFEEKDKVASTFGAMSKKCVTCHSTYATHRFFRE